MKVDTTKLKKSSSELTPECRQLIEQITKCNSRAELQQFLDTVHIWIYGKCELYHWIDILDRFDSILEEAARPYEGNDFVLVCDNSFKPEDTKLLLLVLNFTTLLIEHSFSRHLYNSVEHLTKLLSSENMDIVLAVLNLLYMFSKRSNFIPRLSFDKKEMLLIKLFNIAERWGDPNYGLALIDCCMHKPKLEFLYQLFIEYMDEQGQMTLLEIPDMMDMCAKSSPANVTKTIIDQMSNPTEAVKMRIAHRVRLLSGFKNDKLRLQFVQARLQAVSVLIYSNALNDNTDRVLYPGFGEELCELIDKEDVHLVEIRAAVLRTLTSMLHFDRNPNVPRPGSRLPKIIQYTGAERQSGILPLLVRDCIASLTGNGNSDKYPLILATSLFSLLYHLASYEIGGHALVKSGMMQSLLRVISWPGMDLEHITFVTRAVRVIDLITNIDIAKFHQNNGLNVFIDRLEKEVSSCRKVLEEKRGDGGAQDQIIELEEQRREADEDEEDHRATTQSNADQNMPGADELMAEQQAQPQQPQAAQRRRNSTDSDVVILEEGNLESPEYSPASSSVEPAGTATAASTTAANLPPTSPNSQGESSNNATSATNPEESRDADLDGEQVQYPANSYYSRPFNERNAEYNQMLHAAAAKRPACVTQRAALLKSMLNFLKKSIQDHSHFNGMRNIMETSLPNSLRHIISNAEYYGPSLFLLATDVVTVYVFNEPSLLSSLQDSGLTSVMLQSLLRKDVPATREVVGSLPNVFSALCLNERGLLEFMSYEPFDKLLKVLLSPDYLVAMRRRRSSDPVGDTATNLGNAMDDLMKHHPYLRTDATEAIVRLLNELVRLGTDIYFVCWRANKEPSVAASGSAGSGAGGAGNVVGGGVANEAANAALDASTPAETENEHGDSSGDDDDDDDEMSSASQQQASAVAAASGAATVQQQQPQQQQQRAQNAVSTSQSANTQLLRHSSSSNNILEREAIPLIDYILNVMKFIEAIFSNSSNGEHCHEFVVHGGLKPLLQLLSLPNLPVDSPVSTTAQAVANVCKSILNLAHETKVIDTALLQLSQIVHKLKPLIRNFSFPGGSVLLCELLSCPKPEDGFSRADFTPLLHSMSSVHGYVVMLVCLCRNASTEMRSMLLRRWGAKSDTGLNLLQNLVQLYISLVWESTILLSLCSDEPSTQNAHSTDLNWDEMTALLPMVKDAQKDVNAMETTTQAETTTPSTEEQPSGSNKFTANSAFKTKLKPEDQLRYIKSLLAASSRLGRALAELFGTLVKLTVGTPPARQRHNNEYARTLDSSRQPSADAKEIARVLSSILVNGFTHESIVPRPAPKLKLTFLICSVGFTGPMLFDDKRNAFHLMISQFCEENGLKAFFNIFYWALALDNPPAKFNYDMCLQMGENNMLLLKNHEDDERDLPEGTSEFLDAWLQLLEKMVNPRAVLDSPYALAPPSASSNTAPIVSFEPVFYMVHIHQLAMHAIRRIWKRKPVSNYAISMAETMMAILKHLAKARAKLVTSFDSRKTELANMAKEKSKKAADEASVNQTHLKMLTDMGFATKHAIVALGITRTVEEATEFLINMSQPRNTATNRFLVADVFPDDRASNNSTTSTAAATAASGSTGNDMQVDDPTLSTAIDATINNIQNVFLNCTPSTSGGAGGVVAEKTASTNGQSNLDYTKIGLISDRDFVEFCKEALERTFSFMENLPETIVPVGAELVYMLYSRHSIAERHLFVLNLARNLGALSETVMHNIGIDPCQMDTEDVEPNSDTKLFTRLKVSTILLEETYADMRKDYCTELVHEQTLSTLIQLLMKTTNWMEQVEQDNLQKEWAQPSWLQVLVEFIDAMDNVCTILQRKGNMRAVCSDNWKWYDSSTGKWNAYSDANNTQIKNAYNAGERSVTITIGRQRYTINFSCMKQVSEASGSHRPVLPTLKVNEAICNYARGEHHHRFDKILTRTIRSKPDGRGVMQQDNILCLHSLLNFTPANSPTNPNPGRAVVSKLLDAQSDSTQTVTITPVLENITTTTTATTVAPPTTTTNATNETITTTTASTATATAATSSSATTTTPVVSDATNSNSSTPATQRPPSATLQADDLSMPNSAKKSKPKPSAAPKATGATSKKSPAHGDYLKRITLREEDVGLSKFDTPEIVGCLVRLLNPALGIEFDTKLSILKLCARLTKDYKNARAFYKLGGITRLLSMRQSCCFMGFPTFAIVIIRHMLEPPRVLQDAIERILSMRSWPTLPVGHRDLIYVLTQVSSAVARHPKIFLTAAKNILRADYNASPTFSLDDSRLLVRSALAGNRRNTINNNNNNNNSNTNAASGNNSAPVEADPTASSNATNTANNKGSLDNMKARIAATNTMGSSTTTTTTTATKSVDDLSDMEICMSVIKDLLHALVQPCPHYGGVIIDNMKDLFEEVPENANVTQAEITTTKSAKKSTSTTTNTPTGTPVGAPANGVPDTKVEPCCCSWHIPSNAHWHKKPILPRATLLKVLADSVRSYQFLIPRIIIEHVYTPSDSILIDKPQSFLSFVLYHFVPIVRQQQDAEVSMMSRVLIAALADCYGQSLVQTKVVEELHAAIVRILGLPDSAEKQTRLQVIIGLLPTLIENPPLWNKMHLQRNNMYRILLRQGIMTDLVKVAQYKDLSNSNTLNTLYSILRPMEILLRSAISPGPLSTKRLYFGAGPSVNALVNRRFYPRFMGRNIALHAAASSAAASGGPAAAAASTANAATSGNANHVSVTATNVGTGGETVLRDIIRNVLADRRQHGFDIFLNADDFLLDSEENSPNNGTSGDDDIDEHELNLDRLWDDLMQSDGLRLVNRNSGANAGTASGAPGAAAADHHRHNSNDEDGTANNDAGASGGGGGGSDGASSSSETAAAAAENSLSLILGEVSTSDSDSESIPSTENDDNQDDDDEDNVNDANEAGAEDHSETDGDDEEREFIAALERHIFDRESSETASNDADVDVDEDDGDGDADADADMESDVRTDDTVEAHPITTNASNVSAANSEHAPLMPGRGAYDLLVASQGRNAAATLATASNSNSGAGSTASMVSLPVPNTVSASSSGSVRTMPTFSWMTPRVSAFDGGEVRSRALDMIAAYQGNANNNGPRGIFLTANGVSTQPPVGTPAVGNGINANSTANGVNGGLRRDQNRRLIFLDQQYCAPMPSFANPTEEGQMDLFNQDALHWWLEEAKNLDLESQTDACMYVAHIMVPHLIRELKMLQAQKKTENGTNPAASTSTTSTSSANSNGNIRRSAIPILIQSGNSQTSAANSGATAETRNAELSTPASENAADLTPLSSRDLSAYDRYMTEGMPPLRLLLLSDDDAEAEAEAEAENEADGDIDVDVDADADAEAEADADLNGDRVGEMLEDGENGLTERANTPMDEADSDDELNEDGDDDDEDDDDDDDDDEDDFDDDDDDDEDDDGDEDLHGNYTEEEEEEGGNRTNYGWDQEAYDMDINYEREVIRMPALVRMVRTDRPRAASAPAAILAAREDSNDVATAASVASNSNEPIEEAEEESQPQADAPLVAPPPDVAHAASDSAPGEVNSGNLSQFLAAASAAFLECAQTLTEAANLTTESAAASATTTTTGTATTTTASTTTEATTTTEPVANTTTTTSSTADASAGAAASALPDECPAADEGAGGDSVPAAASATNIPEMSAEVRAALGDLEVPEGVDPSFLAALPREMREEVIQEHLRMQRIRQRAQQNAIQVAQADALVEVNPEFLAALPPNIQSEVLQQQRIEQQRQAAQNTNPEDPVDTAAFFQNLPETLRQTILTDMEDSQIATLPPDLAAEAQYLRRDWETRNTTRMDTNSANTLSGFLSARFHTSLQNFNDESRWHTNSIWYDANGTPQNHPPHHHGAIVHHPGHHPNNIKPIALLMMEEENILLDPDSLATLLLFLFIEDSKMNLSRLFRVIRNLCYHVPTREWIINALISIIKRTNESELNGMVRKRMKPQWLRLRVDAAFGYKSNVFIINKLKESAASGDNNITVDEKNPGEYSISVNPQAAQMVVRNCLDLLFILAKNFPRSFVPYNNENIKTRPVINESSVASNPMLTCSIPLNRSVNDLVSNTEALRQIQNIEAILDEIPSTSKAAAAVRNQANASSSGSKTPTKSNTKLPKSLQNYNTNNGSFWDVLLQIENSTTQRMNNVQLFPLNSQPKWEWNNKQPDFLPFNESPFAKLLEMLPYKVICRSPQLTDLLIKLLASLSSDLPKEDEISEPTAAAAAQPQPPPTTAAPNTTTTTPNTAAAPTTVAAAAAPQPTETPTVAPVAATTTTATTQQVPPSTAALPPVAGIRAVRPSSVQQRLTLIQKMADQQNLPMTTEEKPAEKSKRKMYSKNFSQLQLVIEVLTHQCGTTEGLDHVSKLIVNLSQCSPASNAIFLQYLRAATLGLAQEVREAIQCLLNEIRDYNKLNATTATPPTTSAAAAASSSMNNLSVRQGIMQDRFTSQNIVISANSNLKPTCELQLPAMKRLLSGNSAQPYFLRTLKIFMQIRDLFETQEANAGLSTPSIPKPTLSQIICLDDLWDTLSECLVALEDSKDEYAVLVLQPTVEAFFLIHASHKKPPAKKRDNPSNSGNMNLNLILRRAQAAATTPAFVQVRDVASSITPPAPPPPPPPPIVSQAAATTAQRQVPATSDGSSTQSSSTEQPATASTTNNVPLIDPHQQQVDRQKFLAFAEKHRTVLNQILRQAPTHLSDGPFAVLVDHTRILDFDVKRKYFQKELERIDEGVRREENTVGVRRVTVFEDSFRVLYRLGPEEWKNRFYIVFEDEEGQDAGGLLREWYVIISREIFNPMYALFCVSPGDRVTYMINPSSHCNPNHLSYFKFVGRVIAKAVHDSKLLECYFTRSFYKHILGKQVKYTDMESQDYEFYKGLDYLMKNDISTLGYELTFSTEVQEFGVTQVRDLIPSGRDIIVTEDNKFDYVQLVCQLKMSDSIRLQLDAFLEGFYDIIPKHLISIFNEQELELLISGLPDIDIEDLKSNTEYHKYTSKSIQIQWFWRALRSFDQADRAKFLQFVTGTSKVPLQGFGSLEGMNGIQKFQIHRDDRSTDRLPCAHTCFNQLDLPLYKSYDKLRTCLLKAIHECSEGFGFA